MERQGAPLETLRLAYSEICKSYHHVRDMQLKLLTLIPIASGTAASLVIRDVPKPEKIRPEVIRVVGLLGIGLTLGLFLYSLRGTQHANALSEQGSALEKELELTVGQFKDRPRKWTSIIGYTTASTLIYSVVLLAWAYALYLSF